MQGPLFVQAALAAVIVLGCAWVSGAQAELDAPEQDEIDAIVASADKPEGVVFAIMESDEDALAWVLDRMHRYVVQLHQRFPGLNIVVVSHGDEMTALREDLAKRYPKVHATVKRLVREHGVIFQICGARATYLGIDESEFPAFVEVVPFGPAEIRHYREFGYELVDIELTW